VYNSGNTLIVGTLTNTEVKTMKQFVENFTKKIFDACGFTILRKGRRRTTWTEVLDHFSRLGFRPQTVIDVGVAYGTLELYMGFPEARHLLVEPLKEFQGILEEISRKYTAEYVLAAAGDKTGTITINVHADPSSSSIYKETDGSHIDGIPRKVPVVTIDDLCKERNLEGPYVIKADVQGAELRALDGAKKVLEHTELIILEVSLFQFYVNGPQFYDVVSYMKAHGFVVYDIFNGYNRPLDGALAQVDIVFVKEYGQFRKEHFYRRVIAESTHKNA
jgi:FkbM family methyltransferase